MPEAREVLIIFTIKKNKTHTTPSGLGGKKMSQRNLVEDLKRNYERLH